MAASLAAKEVGILADKGVVSATINLSEEEGDADDEMILVSLQNLEGGMITSCHYNALLTFYFLGYFYHIFLDYAYTAVRMSH